MGCPELSYSGAAIFAIYGYITETLEQRRMTQFLTGAAVLVVRDGTARRSSSWRSCGD